VAPDFSTDLGGKAINTSCCDQLCHSSSLAVGAGALGHIKRYFQRQLRGWCRANGYAQVAEFVEAGASAADDRRPAFQEMIERACDGGQAFDCIVVHSYSRFFREAFEQEFYLRKLAKHGVRVISMTQPDEYIDVHGGYFKGAVTNIAMIAWPCL
jgi:DNA invertase Pin-like site-specific DNA recombinase